MKRCAVLAQGKAFRIFQIYKVCKVSSNNLNKSNCNSLNNNRNKTWINLQIAIGNNRKIKSIFSSINKAREKI